MSEPQYLRVADAAQAAAESSLPGSLLMAGGTEVVAWLAAGLVSPDRLVDLRGAALGDIAVDGSWLSIGANVTLAQVARHELVASAAPALQAAVRGAASPAIREHATLGGNLLQQTRCPYFRGHGDCNRRRPGSGCAARSGDHRRAAVLGGSDQCIAVHPSDAAVALAGLDAELIVVGPQGEERWPFETLYAAAAVDAHSLTPGQVLKEVRVPCGALAASGRYRKVRDRASFDFSLVSAAVHVTEAHGVVEFLTITLGGVAPRPWRCRVAEGLLTGQSLSEPAVRTALAAEFRAAVPLPDNTFKLALCERIVVASLLDGRAA